MAEKKKPVVTSKAKTLPKGKALVSKTIEPKTSKKLVVKSKSLKVKKTDIKSGITVDVLDTKGKKKGIISLPKELFDVPLEKALVAQAVRVYLTNQRQSSAIAQTRGEVNGSRIKIYRQKGTGRARHGDRYAPIFVGGGKAHGPRPRSFEKSLSRKMKRKTLAMVLTAKLQEQHITIVDGLDAIEPKTKLFVTALNALSGNKKTAKEKILIATAGKNDTIYRAGRNVQNVMIRPAMLLTAYEVLNTNRVVFMKDAINQLAKSAEK
jgi:large subunit ribosomal protein L4